MGARGFADPPLRGESSPLGGAVESSGDTPERSLTGDCCSSIKAVAAPRPQHSGGLTQAPRSAEEIVPGRYLLLEVRAVVIWTHAGPQLLLMRARPLGVRWAV